MTVRSFTRLFFAIAILGIHVSSSSAQPLVTGDLTVYYSFDELEGDTFPDGSGNNLHGLVVGLDDDFGDDLEDITVDTEDKVRGAGSVGRPDCEGSGSFSNMARHSAMVWGRSSALNPRAASMASLSLPTK